MLTDMTPSSIDIVSGYRPGLIGHVTALHAIHYAKTSGFGLQFETVVAAGLTDFCARLCHSSNQIWLALHEDQVVGSIAIDGEDLGPGKAHLRWFILSDRARGFGAGRRLLETALSFVDQQGRAETHLWTFAGLQAARHLYETHGFICVEERPGSQWGTEVLEQRFVRASKNAAFSIQAFGFESPTPPKNRKR